MDDGTSVIFTCLWFDNRIQVDDITKYQLGHLVSVTGKLKVFREQKEINIDNIGKMCSYSDLCLKLI